MRRPHPRAVVVIPILACVCGAGPLAAAEVRTRMQVSATIVEPIALRVLHQVQRVTITGGDVARGYFEVPAGSTFSVSTRQPCLLEFRARADIVSAVTVTGLDAPAAFGPAGTTVVYTSHRRGGNVTLGYRVELRRGTTAGVYAWPISLTIVPM